MWPPTSSRASPEMKTSVPPTLSPTGSGTATRVLAALLAACSLVTAWQEGRNVPGLDYHHFWLAIDAVRHRVVPDIYSPQSIPTLTDRYLTKPGADASLPRRRAAAQETSQLGIVATPLLHAALAPFQRGDYERDYNVFLFLSLASFAVAIVLIGRALHLPLHAQLLALAFACTWFGPFSSDTRSANVNRLQLVLVALLIWLLAADARPRRDTAAGAVLAFAVLFKPNLAPIAALLAAYWLLAAQWRRLRWVAIGAGVGGVAAWAASSAFFGSPRCWLDWAAKASHLSDTYQPTLQAGNLSLSELIFTRTGHRPGAWLGIVICTLALAAVAWAARGDALRPPPRDHTPPEFILIAVGASLWLLVAQLAWFHYCILVLPLILWTLRPLPAGDSPLQIRVWFQRVLGAVALVLFNTYVMSYVFAPSLWTFDLLSNLAIAALIAVALAELVRSGVPHGGADRTVTAGAER